MSSEEVTIDASLVHRLITAQFPEWAELPVRPVEQGGWDNRTFHLGDEMSVRLPSAERYVSQLEKEQRWLPRMSPLLPLPIPEPVAIGEPGEEYPWQWSVYRWIDGVTAAPGRIADMPQFAASLAWFLVELQRIDATGGPPPGSHNFFRGGPLATYDQETRRAIAALAGRFDEMAVTAVWERALESTWQGAPVWVHGDVSPGNLLVKDGQLSAVIDFGGLGVGDPACDLAIAWAFFRGESRDAFRSAHLLDDETWARSRGWALWKALIVMAGIARTNAIEASDYPFTVNEILNDHDLNA